MAHLQRQAARPFGPARTLEILLINNASERAFAPTTRRFEALLAAACDPSPVALRVARLTHAGSARLARAAASGLLDAGADAVVVTGAEPVADALRDEPAWPALAALFEAAERRAVPLLLSCMASHAAVLHATGIERSRLPRKLFGIYPERPAGPYAMLAGLPDTLPMPHSRWNTLPVAALEAAPDISVLTRSETGGAGVFAIGRAVPWLCLQGHPEYGPAALAGEYRRDVGRHRAGALAAAPDPPENRAGAEAHAALWQAHGAQVVANWLAACGFGAAARYPAFADLAVAPACAGAPACAPACAGT